MIETRNRIKIKKLLIIPFGEVSRKRSTIHKMTPMTYKEGLNIAIYAIDDDTSMRLTLTAIFKQHNVPNFTMYSNPRELLEDLHRDVHVCIIDYDLNDSDYDGVTLMQAIKAKNSWCKCIIMSGYEEGAVIKRFLNCGAFRYITKGEPHFLEHLMKYLNDALTEVYDNISFYSTLLEQLRISKDTLVKIKDNV